jgi:bifunctional DNA-binding transcriptional regulator/antitoxin component of YhaV-PrlF toxin-antitoxin module
MINEEGIMSSNLLVEAGGRIRLPEEVCEHYGLEPESRIRIIETRSGILLIPLAEEPMSEDLVRELEEWQALAIENIEKFPYEDGDL